MMRLRVEHTTGFVYPGEVSASYNEARMLPVSTENQFVLSSSLDIEPSTSVNQYVDYFGTRVASFDVLSAHTALNITARSLVEVRPRPLEHPEISWEDLAREAQGAISTVEMLAQTPHTAPHEEVARLARSIAAEHDGPGHAAHAIAVAVGDAVEYVYGSTGVHSTAAEAWEKRSGVCQDMAHITLGALREVGIPARYVSGYLHPDPDAEVGVAVVGESHAWVEWFAGDWHGFDPTNNVEIGERHVLVGRGRDYSDVPPLRGVYGGATKSDLHVQVTITREA
ncbi:transglutaminase family protein [Microbacterium sp. zg.Y1090]|uniref:transglutaminase family protein n=1 Tax=Microbacterium TaxID=33882 RepID=UPI00214BBECD|nr:MULTISPECIES: transglutaminase family protein [unclassified Microbacterium]MCR2812303.1 transglutaminase family protein [Microbacterium sp. zg.Y1084]MCR2819807.1 transglutaminase family protein [Microbacterium sp. zg.Y1090]MDL5485460.1 transglutaminase family protein [Microbacterium sp. zg-Y1211]WIM28635.1 transglutaminase family protein [Microbacterium sp. zg-Y1090]